MAAGLSKGIDRLRQPEYTGENRCVPCTVVNALIAVVLAAAVAAGAVRSVGPAAGTLAGLLALLLSFAAIYLRGYLVPGTPWFTKTYFPDWLLRHFDKHATAGTVDGDVDPEAVLLGAGAVAECEGRDDLCLEDDFRSAWRERIGEVRDSDASHDDLADTLDVDPDRLTLFHHGGPFVVNVDDRRAGQWESREAFVADMAAERELRTRYAGWSALGVRQRSAVLNGLRIFLDRCPGCDGAVTMDEEVVESCCRSRSVIAVTCEDCDARLFEANAPPQAE